MTSINLPEGVEKICEGAFSSCSGVTYISLPNSLKEIEFDAFTNMPELAEVYCFAINVPKTDGDNFGGYSTNGWKSDAENAILYVPERSIEQYKAIEPWSDFKEIKGIPSTGITEIQKEKHLKEKHIFSLDGRLVTNPTKGRIYIVNGKKTAF